MVYKFDPGALKLRLETLPPWGQLSFGALLLERAIPNFLQFQVETGAAGGAILRGTQAKVWTLLEVGGGSAMAPLLGITANACEFFAPDTEKYTSLYTSSALDAVSIACNLLDYVDSNRVELLVDSSALRLDSIDLFLQRTQQVDASAPDFETRLLAHLLMQEELGFQDTDVKFLEESRSKGDQGWTAALARSLDLGYCTLRMVPPRN